MLPLEDEEIFKGVMGNLDIMKDLRDITHKKMQDSEMIEQKLNKKIEGLYEKISSYKKEQRVYLRKLFPKFKQLL